MITELVKQGFAFTFSSPSFLGKKVKGGLPTGDSGSTPRAPLTCVDLIGFGFCSGQPETPGGHRDWGTWGHSLCHPHLFLADAREWGQYGPSGHRRM